MPDLMLDLHALTPEQKEELLRDLDDILVFQHIEAALTANLLPFVNRLMVAVHEARDHNRDLVEMAVMETGAVCMEHVRNHPDYHREIAELQRVLRVAIILYPSVTRSMGGELLPDARVRVFLLPSWQVPPVRDWGKEGVLGF